MEQIQTNSNIEMYQADLEELEKFINQTTRPNLKRQFEESKRNMTYLLEDEKRKLEKSKQAQTAPKTTEEPQLNFVTVSKYALDSGDKFVKIYLTDGFANLKDLATENIKAKFNKKSFEVQILNWNKKNYKFCCGNLNKEIDAEGSYTKATGSGLTIFLKKVKASDHWDALEYKKPLAGTQEAKPDMAKDPSSGLMDMMKEMYQSGDPEMKKLIAESFAKAGSEQGGQGSNFNI